MVYEDDLNSLSVLDVGMNCFEATTHFYHEEEYNGGDLLSNMNKVINDMERVTATGYSNMVEDIVLDAFQRLSVKQNCATASTNADTGEVQEEHIDNSFNLRNDASNDLENSRSVAKRAQSVNSLDSFSFDLGLLSENTKNNDSVDRHFLDDLADLSRNDVTIVESIDPLLGIPLKGLLSENARNDNDSVDGHFPDADDDGVTDDNCIVGRNVVDDLGGLSPNVIIGQPMCAPLMCTDNDEFTPMVCL